MTKKFAHFLLLNKKNITMSRKRRTLKFQFSIFIIALFSGIIVTFSVLFYYHMKKGIIERNKEMITSQLQDFSDVFDLLQNENRKNIEKQLITAHYVFYNDFSGNIVEDQNKTVEFDATHFYSQQTISTKLNKWTINGLEIHNNFEIVDKIQLLGVNSAIFQKTEDGFVNISSSITNANDRKGLGIILTDDLSFLPLIESGETYYGRVFIVDNWYYAAFEPIKINNQVKGILCVVEEEKNLEILKEKFYSKKVLDNGYPFIMSNCEMDKGKMVINPFFENENWASSDVPEKKAIYLTIQQNFLNCQQDATFQETKTCSFNFEAEFNNQIYSFDCKYYDEYKYFICITNSVYELVDKPLHKLRLAIFLIGFISLVFDTFVVFKFMSFSLRSIDKVLETIKKMSKGELVESIEVTCNKEIADISDSLNILSYGVGNSAKFAEAIGKQNFNFEYIPLSDKDVLGNALLKMRTDLSEYSKIREENSWTQDAVVKVSNILRGDKNTFVLANELLNLLAEIINYQVAAIYLTNENNVLVLSGTYAFNVRKSNCQEFKFGEGLIGQAALEQKTIIYKSAPADFILIQSGLGETSPSNILVVPLVFDGKVLGVAEFATTYQFTERQVNLLNRISESIAIAFNTINSNNKTKLLLEQTLEQSEELKTQQEELKSINESLSEQSQKLEESHEELASLNEGLKLHQEEIQFQADKLAIITETVPALLAYISIEQEFLYVNEKYAEFFGKKPKEIEGLKLTDFFTGNDLVHAQDVIDKITDGHPMYFENKKVVNGCDCFISMNFVPQKDEVTGKVKAVLLMIQDITESKKAEETIRKSEERLKAVISTSAAGFGIVKPDGYFSEVNETLCNLLGYTESELLQIPYIDLLHKDDKLSSELGIKKFFEGGIPVQNIERRYIKKDGTVFWASLSPSPLKNNKNEIDSLVAVVIDITERVEAENEIKRFNEQLFVQNEEIATQRDNLKNLNIEIESQKNLVELKNKSITDSINYAQRIQKAVIKPDKLFNAEQIFVFLKPKDIVSGDFFYIKEVDNLLYFAAIDCTGHGVPGAFMSILGISFLNEIIGNEIIIAGNILDELRKKVKISLGQTGKYEEAKDGMDMALCVINKSNNSMTYAGAHNPMYLVRNDELIDYKATKNPIGIYLKEIPFENHEISLLDNDVIYLSSDGYIDQTGYEHNEKFKTKRFKELLVKINKLPMNQQQNILEENLLKWQGKCDQIDDILVMGYKVGKFDEYVEI